MRAVADLVPAHQVEPVLHEVQPVAARHVQHIGRSRHHRPLQLAAPAVVLRHKATELADARVQLHREAHRVEQTGRADGHDRVPHLASAARDATLPRLLHSLSPYINSRAGCTSAQRVRYATPPAPRHPTPHLHRYLVSPCLYSSTPHYRYVRGARAAAGLPASCE